MQQSAAYAVSGYLIDEKIGEGAMGVVYRATHRLTGRTVALKRMLAQPGASSRDTTAGPVPATSATFATLAPSASGESITRRVAIAREFRTLASLHHPHIVHVLDYGFDAEQQPYFAMELLPAAQTLADWACDQPLRAKVEALVALLQTLVYLHRRGILHRDLKPSNILVDGGTVKVVDFGIAAAQADVRGAAGTLVYMAPEIFLGQPASPASDLYSVGVIAYELLVGERPIDPTQPGRLLADVLGSQADATLDPEVAHYVHQAGADVDRQTQSAPLGEARGRLVSDAARQALGTLAPVVEKLLARDPRHRYADASLVIRDLSAALGTALPVETEATRESFLQASALVGREAEAARLTQALEDAVTGGGGCWLLGGESGVGKSRVLEELRTVALVRGAAVVQGQAVSDGGGAYQVWLDVLRALCLVSAVSDADAAVLKQLLPDIGALLQRPVADAPTLTSDAARVRLQLAAEQLFRARTAPLVVILEDLHWADEASLQLLARVAPLAPRAALLLVGSYRDDETPDLPAQVPSAERLKLDRLDRAAVARLTESMLGAAGRRRDLVELLHRETEGNAFFLVEIMRALAEQAGRLDLVADAALPESVITGGIEKLTWRRLDRVPPTAQPLLELAAVAGRELHGELLGAVAPDVELPPWLWTCAGAAVLESRDGRWRFAHDKLREGVLRRLPAERRRALHRTVAEAIERLHPDAREQSAVLAHHWAMVGDLQREGHYAALAGEQAVRRGAYGKEALRLLKRALHAAEAGGAPAERCAALERQIGEAHYLTGNAADADVHLRRALALLGDPAPATKASAVAALASQLARQVGHWAAPAVALRLPTRSAPSLERVRVHERMAEIAYYANDSLGALCGGLAALNIAERLPPSRELSHAYSNLAVLASLVPSEWAEARYERVALAAARATNDTSALGWALFTAGIYRLGVGRIDEAQAMLQQSVEAAEKTGDRFRYEQFKVAEGWVSILRGELAQAEALCQSVAESTAASGNVDIHNWALLMDAIAQVRRGEFDTAGRLVEEVLAARGSKAYRTAEIIALGIETANCTARGDTAAAGERADRTLAVMGSEPATAFMLLPTFRSVAAARLDALAAAPPRPGDGAAPLAREARRRCEALQAFARTFSVGRADAALAWGRYHGLLGARRKADAALAAAASEAARFGMRYELADARREQARALPRGDGARASLLAEAGALFEACGARAEHARCAVL